MRFTPLLLLGACAWMPTALTTSTTTEAVTPWLELDTNHPMTSPDRFTRQVGSSDMHAQVRANGAVTEVARSRFIMATPLKAGRAVVLEAWPQRSFIAVEGNPHLVALDPACAPVITIFDSSRPSAHLVPPSADRAVCLTCRRDLNGLCTDLTVIAYDADGTRQPDLTVPMGDLACGMLASPVGFMPNDGAPVAAFGCGSQCGFASVGPGGVRWLGDIACDRWDLGPSRLRALGVDAVHPASGPTYAHRAR